MFWEVNQNSLSLLSLSCEAELFEKFTQCNVKGVTFKAEVLEVFFCHHTTEVIAEKKIKVIIYTKCQGLIMPQYRV